MGIDGDGDRWLCPGEEGPEDDGAELAKPSLMVGRGPPPPAAIRLKRLQRNRGGVRVGYAIKRSWGGEGTSTMLSRSSNMFKYPG